MPFPRELDATTARRRTSALDDLFLASEGCFSAFDFGCCCRRSKIPRTQTASSALYPQEYKQGCSLHVLRKHVVVHSCLECCSVASKRGAQGLDEVSCCLLSSTPKSASRLRLRSRGMIERSILRCFQVAFLSSWGLLKGPSD